jgi:hypothetical protein
VGVRLESGRGIWGRLAEAGDEVATFEDREERVPIAHIEDLLMGG